MLRSVLNDWNYFWTKYCKLPFLAICCSQFPLLIFFTLSWYQKVKITLWESLGNTKKCFEQKDLLMKKWLIVILKGFSSYSRTKYNFSHFFFFSHWLLYECYFPFLIKAFADFEKLIRFHWQAFIVYRNWENLEKMKEIFH